MNKKWLLTCVAGIFLLIYILGILFNVTRAEWPAWAQALGSIVAILAASAMVVLQARRHAEAEKRRIEAMQEQILQNVIAITQEASYLVQRAYEFRITDGNSMLDTPAYRTEEMVNLKDMLMALKNIPLHELPNPDAVRALAAMRRIVARTVLEIRAISDAKSGHVGSDNFWEQFEELALQARRQTEIIGRTQLRAAVSEQRIAE